LTDLNGFLCVRCTQDATWVCCRPRNLRVDNRSANANSVNSWALLLLLGIRRRPARRSRRRAVHAPGSRRIRFRPCPRRYEPGQWPCPPPRAPSCRSASHCPFRLVHFLITLTFLVLRRGRRSEQGSVNDRPLTHQQAFAGRVSVDSIEDPARHFVVLQQAAELQQRGRIGRRFMC